MFRLIASTLFLFGTVWHSATPASGCSIPSTYAHRTTLTWGNFLVTLATDRQVYAVGDSVHFWLSFENTGTNQDTIPNPTSISPMDAIVVFPAGCDSLSQDGCRWLYLFPHLVYYFGLPVILDPGACASYEHTWNGIDHYNQPIVPGTYTVIGGMISGLRFHAPPGGIRFAIQLESTVAVSKATWGVIKFRYYDRPPIR